MEAYSPANQVARRLAGTFAATSAPAVWPGLQAFALPEQVSLPTWAAALLFLGVGVVLALGEWRLRRQRGAEHHGRQSEARRETSSQRLAGMLDNVDDVIMLSDQHRRIVEVNRRAEAFYGYSQAELIGMSLTELRAPQARAEFEETRSHYESGEHIVFQTVHRRKNGTVFPVEISSRWVELGGARFSLGILRDISERQRAEASLRLSEERLRHALEGATDGLWDWDLVTGILYLSPRYAEMLGYETGALPCDRDHWRKLVHPEDLPRLERAFEDYLAGALPVFRCEYRMRARNEEWLWMLSRAKVVARDAQGKPVRIVGTHNDITQRQRAETERERLIAILERTPDFVSISDLQGRSVYLNATGRRLSGLASETEVRKRQIADYHPGWAAELILKEGLPVAEREGIWIGETALLSSTGTELPVSQVIMAHKDAQGIVTHYSTIMRDLSERKRIERVLRTNEERLRTIIEHSTQLHYSHTPDHVLTYVSPQSREFFDCEPEEAMVRWTEFVTDNPINLRGMELTEVAIRTGQRQPSYELELVTRTGRRLWVEVRESPVVIKGRTVAIVGSLSDITQRKRSEQIVQRLTQLGRDLGTATESAQAAKTVAEAAQDLLGWDACFLKVRTPDLRQAHFMLSMDTVNGERRTVPSPAAALDQISPVERRVVEEGALMILREPQTREMFIPFGDTARPSLSLLYVPLRHQGRYVGLFSIQSYRPQAYNHDALDLLQTLADHAAGALERIRAEQALAEREHRYRTLFDLSPAGILLEDAAGTILDANAAMGRIFGYTREELIGRDVRVLVPPERLAAVDDHVAEVLAGKTLQHETSNLAKDGTQRRVELRETAVPLPSGCQGILVLVQDVTERSRAEEALRESERFLTKAQEVARLGCYSLDVTTGWWTATPMLRTVFGLTPDHPQNVEGWLQLVHADDRAGMQHYLLEHVLRSRQRFEKEYRIRRLTDGEERWVFGLGELELDAAGNPVRMVGTIQDITDRKRAEAALRESEKRHRLLIETTNTGYVIIDGDGRVVDANQEYVRLTGRRRLEEILGRPVTEWTAPHDLERNAVEVGKCIQQGFVRNLEVDYISPEGEITPLEINATVLRAGGTVSIQTLCRDITERRRAERALRESEQRFRSIVQSSPLGMHMYTLAADNRLIFRGANPASDRMLGVHHEQFLGKEIVEAFPSLKETEIPQRYREAAARGVPWQTSLVEYQDRQIKGAFEVFAFQTASGQMAAMFQEVTERRRAEQRERQLAAENERLLKNLQLQFNAMPVGCIVTRPDLTVMDWNPAAERIFGFARDEMLDQRPFGRFIPTASRQAVEQFMAELMGGSETRSTLNQNLTKDGRTIVCEWHDTPLRDEAGGVVGVLAMVQDMTERLRAEAALRESERRLSTVIANLPAGFAYRCRNDRDWTMDFITVGVKALTGVAPEEFTGRRLAFNDCIQPDDRDRVYDEIQQSLARREPYQLEYRIQSRGGEEKWVWEQGLGLFNHQGEVEALEGLVVDITARKRAETALRELSGRLLAAQDEERRRIARDLHDTTAQTIAALCMNLTLLHARLPADNREALRVLADAVALGERAGQEIRTVAYLLHPPILEHVGLVGALREFAAGFDRRSGIHVTVDVGAGLPRFAPEVELALLRIVQESLGNVHRHSGSRTATLRLRTTKEQITLEVEDVGVGFNPPDLAGGEEGGLGVGIAGMRERLRHLGGQLTITSGAGGTTVRARLPSQSRPRTRTESHA